MRLPALTHAEERFINRVKRLCVEDGLSTIALVPRDRAGDWLDALEVRLGEVVDQQRVHAIRVSAADLELGPESALATGIASAYGDDEVELGTGEDNPRWYLVRGGEVSGPQDSLVRALGRWLAPLRAAIDRGAGARLVVELVSAGFSARSTPETIRVVEYPTLESDELASWLGEFLESALATSDPSILEYGRLRLLDACGNRPSDLGELVGCLEALPWEEQLRFVEVSWTHPSAARALEARRAELEEACIFAADLSGIRVPAGVATELARLGAATDYGLGIQPTPRTWAALGLPAASVQGRDRVAEATLIACFRLERLLREVVMHATTSRQGRVALERALATSWGHREPRTLREVIRSTSKTRPDDPELLVASFGHLSKIAEFVLPLDRPLLSDLWAAVELRNDLAHQHGVTLEQFRWIRRVERTAAQRLAATA